MLETAQPYGVSKALSEVLSRTREHLEANERAEVARHIQRLMERSGLGPAEFASRIGVPSEQFTKYLSGATSPSASLMPDAPAVGSVRQDPSPPRGRLISNGRCRRPTPLSRERAATRGTGTGFRRC